MDLVLTDKIGGEFMWPRGLAPRMESLSDCEWGAIFLDELNVPFDRRLLETESFSEANRLKSELFKNSLPDFPLLARVYDFYEDAFFENSELSSLIGECMNLIRKSENPTALEGVCKLIRFARWGIEIESGLYLRAD